MPRRAPLFASGLPGVLDLAGQPTKGHELCRKRTGSRTPRSAMGVVPPSAPLAPLRRCSPAPPLTEVRASATAATGQRRRSLRTAFGSTGRCLSTAEPAVRRCALRGLWLLSGRTLGSTRARGAARSVLRSLASLVRPFVSSSSRVILALSLPPCRLTGAPCPGERKCHAVSACLW